MQGRKQAGSRAWVELGGVIKYLSSDPTGPPAWYFPRYLKVETNCLIIPTTQTPAITTTNIYTTSIIDTQKRRRFGP